MQKRESRNELLEKWRVEKGKPLRSEKPWMPTGRIKPKLSTEPLVHVQKTAKVGKSPSQVVKPQPLEEAKPIHTNFLKRRSGMVKWSHFGYSEDAKRRRVSPRLTEKENLPDSAPGNAVGNDEAAKPNLLNETPSVASKLFAVKNELVKETRRDLLSEWKTTRKVLEDSNSNQTRRQTIALIPAKRGTSPTYLRRQTMIMSKKAKIQLPPKNVPAKVPDEFKKALPTDFQKKMNIPVTPRRQTVVIRGKNTACLPKKAVDNATEGPVKPACIPRCASQPSLKRQKTKEIQPSHKVQAKMLEKGEKKQLEQKATAGDGVNVTVNKVRASLSQLHLKTARGNQSSNIAASSSTSQTANKTRRVRTVLRKCSSSATITALQKTAVVQSKPADKVATIQAKLSNQTVVVQGKPSSVTVTIKPAKRPDSRVAVRRNVGARPATRQISQSTPKLEGKMTNAECPQSHVPLTSDVPLVSDVPDKKSATSSLVVKPVSKTPKSRKNVAFEIPVRSSNSRKSPSLRRRLSSWLEAKGRTPSAFRHLHCFGVELSEVKRKAPARSRSLGAIPSLSSCQTPTSDACCAQLNPRRTWLAGRTPLRMINEDEPALNYGQRAISFPTNTAEDVSETESENETKMFEEALVNLSVLLDNAYSIQEATEWLDAMFERTQNVCKLAAYWVCRAKISELGNDKAEALALLAAGTSCSAQPVDKLVDMRARLTEGTSRASLGVIATPRPRRRTDFALNAENVFSSTLIKYIVKDETPISKRLWGEASESLVTVTPVRRTHRRSSLAITPSSTSKHSMVQFVTSLDDIPDELKHRMVVVPNPPLKMLLDSPHQW